MVTEMNLMAIQEVPPSKIKIDIGVQIRVKLDYRVIERYAAEMVAGDKFPPIVLFFDGKEYWLADGFHRIEALKSKYLKVFADVRNGTREDAIRYAITANFAHGLPLTNADKRRAIRLALTAWPGDSDMKIAARLRVSDKTVKKMRTKTESGSEIPNLNPTGAIKNAGHTKRTGRDGKSYPATKKAKSQPEPEDPDAMPPSIDEEEPPPSTDVPVDKVGTPIPTPEMVLVFERAVELDRMLRQVNAISKAVTEANGDPLFCKFLPSAFQLECQHVSGAIAAAKPHAVCPFCGGDGKANEKFKKYSPNGEQKGGHCGKCHGHGWHNKVGYESIAREFR